MRENFTSQSYRLRKLSGQSRLNISETIYQKGVSKRALIFMNTNLLMDGSPTFSRKIWWLLMTRWIRGLA
jgi:hypothetical protein